MIKRIAVYGILSGVGAIWVTGYLVEKVNKHITSAVNGAWRRP